MALGGPMAWLTDKDSESARATVGALLEPGARTRVLLALTRTAPGQPNDRRLLVVSDDGLAEFAHRDGAWQPLPAAPAPEGLVNRLMALLQVEEVEAPARAGGGMLPLRQLTPEGVSASSLEPLTRQSLAGALTHPARCHRLQVMLNQGGRWESDELQLLAGSAGLWLLRPVHRQEEWIQFTPISGADAWAFIRQAVEGVLA